MSLLEDHWPKLTLPMALVSTALIFLFFWERDTALLLIWLQTPVYFLHQFEEYIYPGGFVALFNRTMLGSDRPDWPLTKRESFWINIPIIFVLFPLSALLASTVHLALGIWTACFSILNAMSHLGMFARKGYNPGFVVSLLLNIPLGVFTIWYCASNALLPLSAYVVGVVIAVVLQGGIMIYGLRVLRGKVIRQAR